MRTRRALIGLLLSSLPSLSLALEWSGIRDGAVHVWPTREELLHIEWSPAWQADANQEQLYLQRGNGQLVQRFAIPAEEVQGRREWRIKPDDDGYRLEIPGYSFRHYRVRHPDTAASLFEPVKHHFSLETGRELELYFRVPAGVGAQLGGKHHDGVRALHAERLSDGKALTLQLRRHGLYPRHDLLSLPVSERDEIWRLRLVGTGKAAFWLDNTDNLFAQRPEDLRRRPSQAEGRVNLTLRDSVVGPPARLGIGLPYTLPEDAQLMGELRPQTAGHYSFVNVMARNPAHEQRFRPQYRHRYGIDHDITLMAKTGRVHLLDFDATSRAGLKAWLDSTISLGKGGIHYLSPADEPNLNYPSYAAFSRYFAQMARQVRDDPRAQAAGIRIAMPASSRLVNGPTMQGARDRRGLDWAARLLAEHEPLIDALAWHEWFIRDLRATEWYRYSVRQAADLVGYTPQGRPRKALLIDQTNLSSGNTVSPYEQETRFAALWWASVAIQASQDGLLDMLNWFLLADDDHHFKGLLKLETGDRYSLRPVGQAMVFMLEHWGDQVLKLDNDAFEIDALAMRSGVRMNLLGVNKVARNQQVRFDLDGTPCSGLDPPHLTLFGDGATPSSPRCEDTAWRFEVPGETLFALTWEQP